MMCGAGHVVGKSFTCLRFFTSKADKCAESGSPCVLNNFSHSLVESGVGVFQSTYNVFLVILVEQGLQNPKPPDATLSPSAFFLIGKI